jgi:Fe-S-cluster containining protein
LVYDRSYMDIALKITLLDQFYRLFEDYAGTQTLACKRQCATCCTCNMTLTTLEGYKIISFMDARIKATLVQHLQGAVDQRRFRPQMTINQMARRCMTGQEIPEEDIDPAWGVCPLLYEKECPIYAARPFGCRCMMSKTSCAETGCADVDAFTLTVADLFHQFIEHLDQGGLTGNLIDVMLFLDDDKNALAYQSNKIGLHGEGLIPNIPIPVLMIPPEHRERVEPLLDAIRKLLDAPP